MKIITVVGARPQFIKAAPVSRALRRAGLREIIVHTGQHYDAAMSRVFFEELKIKEPGYNLGIGSDTHGVQTGRMLERVEQVLLKERPGLVIVYGDTNSTLAGALSAAKLHIPVAHVEAGLRSFNRIMPEETNRVLTDHISDILFCPTETAVKNLRNEGFGNIINRGKLVRGQMSFGKTVRSPVVLNVGDVMYDSVLYNSRLALRTSRILNDHHLSAKGYYLATVHRAENTDDPKRIKGIFSALGRLSKHIPVVVPLHPRTEKYLLGLQNIAKSLTIIPPVSYLDMLMLSAGARVILTDSGGLQKEAFFLEVPCVTLRDETEWIETLQGSRNMLAGHREDRIVRAVESQEKRARRRPRQDVFGDGNAAEKIVRSIRKLK